jgi:hypothetical protein
MFLSSPTIKEAGVPDFRTEIPSKALRSVDSTERFYCDHHHHQPSSRNHVQFKMTDTLIEVHADEFYGCDGGGGNYSDYETEQKTRWPSPRTVSQESEDYEDEDGDGGGEEAKNGGQATEKDVLVVEKDEETQGWSQSSHENLSLRTKMIRWCT